MFTLPTVKEKSKEIGRASMENVVEENEADELKEKIEILLVEDTPSDVRLTQEALKGAAFEYELSVVNDGVEALEYLNKIKLTPDGKLPHIILLDLNMPRKNGHELLEDIHNDSVLRTIPVVLLTVSERDEDVLEALRTKMNYYLAKPVTAEKLCALLKTLQELYIETEPDNSPHTLEELHIRFVLAGNPHTAMFVLERLADDSSARVRAKLAENCRISKAVQLKLASDPALSVRISLCDNPGLDLTVAQILARDKDDDVRLALTTCPLAAIEILKQLSTDENVFVSESAKKSLSSLEEGLPIAAES
jgi:CheY-like chemotaxis protein